LDHERKTMCNISINIVFNSYIKYVFLSFLIQRMSGQMRLLSIACAAKARPRTVTLTRSTKDEILHFSVLGGMERNCGIFISKVERGSKASEAGLKRGDQVSV
jgi:hypothetical protein